MAQGSAKKRDELQSSSLPKLFFLPNVLILLNTNGDSYLKQVVVPSAPRVSQMAAIPAVRGLPFAPWSDIPRSARFGPA